MACEVVSEVVEAGVDANDENVSETFFAVLEHLLMNGLMEAGDVTDTGFIPWPVDPTEALSIIKAEWRKLDELPNLGDVCWLNNTALGDELGRNRAHH